jgi:hypothetical protein
MRTRSFLFLCPLEAEIRAEDWSQGGGQRTEEENHEYRYTYDHEYGYEHDQADESDHDN